MESLIAKIRNAFRRTSDRIAGRHVPIRMDAQLEGLGSRRLLTPPVDVFESDEEILIIADTPGAFPDNTKLHWGERSGLSLYVRRSDETEAEGWWGDDLRGDWYRAWTLPEYVNPDDARAAVRDGVLTVQIPKQAAPASVSIPITAS